jgi:mono/diheme cytochrome c family protein
MNAAFLVVCLAGPPAATDAAPDVEHGRYLVHRVAMCVECHSPRDAQGRLLEGRLLTGGRIPVRSPYPGSDWAFEAPHLAGLPGWDGETVESILVTGRRPGGYDPRHPMPDFRMSREDAKAIVAYLRSLR